MSHAKIAGSLFLTAMVASLTGGTLVQLALVQPQSVAPWVLILGVGLEALNALAVIGIAAALWVPLVLRYPGVTVAYAGMRAVEAAVCVIAAFLPLALLGSTDHAALIDTIRSPLVSYAVPVIFGIGAILLYAMLYRSALVPRYVAIWGLLGALGVLANVFVTDPAFRPLLVLPIITNEIYLGVYLLTRAASKRLSNTPSAPPST